MLNDVRYLRSKLNEGIPVVAHSARGEESSPGSHEAGYEAIFLGSPVWVFKYPDDSFCQMQSGSQKSLTR